MPDLTISILGIERDATAAQPQKTIKIDFRISNIGTADATSSFQWSVTGSNANNNPVTGTISSLSYQGANFVDSSVTLTYQNPTTSDSVTLIVDSGNSITPELSDTNNQITTSISNCDTTCTWT